MSHVATYQQFANISSAIDLTRAEKKPVEGTESRRTSVDHEGRPWRRPRSLSYLLVLEDDAGVSPALFDTLIPCLAQLIPDPDWHVIRLSPWGNYHAKDRHSPGLYRAQAHSFSEYGGMSYGGTHASLFRASAMDLVLEYLLDRGVMGPDCALRVGDSASLDTPLPFSFCCL